VFAALLPFYKDVFLILIVNTVLPLFFYYVVLMLVKSSKKEKIKSLKKVLNWRYVLVLMLVVFSLGWVSDLIFGLLKIQQNYVFSIMTMLLLSKLIEAAVKKADHIKAWHVFLAIALIRFVFRYEMLTLTFWKYFIFLSIGFAIVRLFVFDLGVMFTNDVKVFNLKKGMIPAELIQKDYKKIKAGHYSMGQMKDTSQLLFDITIEGFSEKDIEKLKKLQSQGKLHFTSIKVLQTIAFAPFLFIGGVLTYFFGNIVSYIAGWL